MAGAAAFWKYMYATTERPEPDSDELAAVYQGLARSRPRASRRQVQLGALVEWTDEAGQKVAAGTIRKAGPQCWTVPHSYWTRENGGD
jgi:hypothetical protein